MRTENCSISAPDGGASGAPGESGTESPRFLDEINELLEKYRVPRDEFWEGVRAFLRRGDILSEFLGQVYGIFEDLYEEGEIPEDLFNSVDGFLDDLEKIIKEVIE